MNRNTTKATPEQAHKKIKQFCAYQERCHSEVKEKLYSFGLWKKEVEEIISRLIEENYLNEERFALQYAGGKFRMKHWGRTKIRYALKQKQVSEYCIRKAMKEIPEDEYTSICRKLVDEKWRSLKSERNIFVKKRKTMDFLLQKGYERDMVMEIIGNR